jgi:hypothetical protein
MDNFDLLEQEMKGSDKESDKFVALAVIAIVLISVGLAAALFLLVEDPQPWLVGAVMPVILLSQGYFLSRSHQRRAQIFARHGFRCQSCKKTPSSLRLFKQTSRKFCPYCQLKYAP